MMVGREPQRLGATLVLGPRVPDEAAPSPGYRFIGWLASVGYFDVILSCQDDARLEDSVRAFLPTSRVKVLNRGEMQDDVIADLISSSSEVCKIVKLRGDSVSRTLLGTQSDVPPMEQPLIDAVKRRAGQELLVVGADADDPAIAPLLPHDRPTLVPVDHFDISFRDLGLVVGRHLGLQRSREKKTFESRMAAGLHAHPTSRDELWFPWGPTSATSMIERVVETLDGKHLMQIHRSPWGKREILVDQQPCSVRILTLEPHERTSLQRHALRDEMFIALDDGIGFQMSGDELDRTVNEADPRLHSFILERHHYLMVPRGIWHSIRAPQSRVRVLEVAFGLYDEVEDIERVLDKYGRV